jgi:hypothetical protein
VRDDLGALNEYVRVHCKLDGATDPGWLTYRKILTRLRQDGKALCNALFSFKDSRSQDLLEELCAMPPGSDLKVHCSDDEVTIPFHFIYTSNGAAHEVAEMAEPSRADFSGFWLNQFKITMLIAGSICDPSELVIDPIWLP